MWHRVRGRSDYRGWQIIVYTDTRMVIYGMHMFKAIGHYLRFCIAHNTLAHDREKVNRMVLFYGTGEQATKRAERPR